IDDDWIYTGEAFGSKIRYRNKFQVELINIDNKERKELIETAYKNTPINLILNNTQINTNLYELLKEELKKDNRKNLMSVGVYKLPEANFKTESENENFIEKNKELIMTLGVKNTNLDIILEYFKNELNEIEFEKIKTKFLSVCKNAKENRFLEFTRLANNLTCNTKEEKKTSIFLIKEMIPMLVSFIVFNLSIVFNFATNKRDLIFYSNSTNIHANYYLRAFEKAIAIPPEKQILKNGLNTNIIIYKNIVESDNIQKTIEILETSKTKWYKENSNPAGKKEYYEILNLKNEILYLNNDLIICEISTDLQNKKNIDVNYFKTYPQNPRLDFSSENEHNTITIGLFKIDENNKHYLIFTVSLRKRNFFELQNTYLSNIKEFEKIHVANFFSKLQMISDKKELFEFTGFKSYDKFKESNVNMPYLNMEKMFAFLLIKSQTKFKTELKNMNIFANLPDNYSLFFKKHYKDYIKFSTDKNLTFNNTTQIKNPFYTKSLKSNLILFNEYPTGNIRKTYLQILNLYKNENTAYNYREIDEERKSA
ncbi:MAG: hypothetical protein KC589_03570, partial [Nanoarchaeota archaeon]|nr:hypothetical protein [Nanoarchaeota archaeon]